jgi:hypothetical protein
MDPGGGPKWPGRTNGFNLIFFTELYMGCNPVIKMFRYSENTTMQEHNIHNQFPLSDCLRRFNSPTAFKRVGNAASARLMHRPYSISYADTTSVASTSTG